MDLFHQAISGHRREALFFTDIFISARASERFESRLLSRRPAVAHEAHARGLRLLQDNLSPAQRDQFDRCGCFEVVGGETGRRYRIRYGHEMNVELLDRKGGFARSLCFMPEGKLAVGDVMLAQKLALELFESETLEIANTFTRGHPLFDLIS
jgi:hypothetical protein